MADHDSIVSSDKLKDIADAIRAKTHKEAKMTLDDMPDEIASISSGGGATPECGVVHSEWSSLGYVLSADVYGDTILPAIFANSEYSPISPHEYYPDGNPEESDDDTSDSSGYYHDYASQYAYIRNITFHDDINYIGPNAFYKAYWFELNELPSTLTYIGDSAFVCCYSANITEIPASVSFIGYDAFSQIGTPWEVIPSYQEDTTYSVGDITYYDGSYYQCIEDVVEPEPFDYDKFEYISHDDIQEYFPAPILTFLGTPATIESTAFSDSYFSEIRVPWGPDEVDNAPWGFRGNIVYLWGKNIGEYIINNKYAVVGSSINVQVTLVESQDPSIDYGSEYTITASGNATLTWDDTYGYQLTPDLDASDGDEVILTISSVKDPTYTFNKVITLVVPSVSINLLDSEWTDSGTTQEGHTVYDCPMSTTTDNICEINVKGYRRLAFYFRKTNANTYPYIYFSRLDDYISTSHYYTTSNAITNTTWSYMYGKSYLISADATLYPEEPFYVEEPHTIRLMLPKSSSSGTLPHIQFYVIASL